MASQDVDRSSLQHDIRNASAFTALPASEKGDGDWQAAVALAEDLTRAPFHDTTRV